MKKTVRAALWILFAAYALLMLWLLFFQRTAVVFTDSYREALLRHLNLIPGRTLKDLVILMRKEPGSALYRFAVINLFGNVIMFIPLGVFLTLLFEKQRKLPLFLLTSVLLISAVELTQLFTLLGSCDVDDLILNVIGLLCGFFLVKPIKNRRS